MACEKHQESNTKISDSSMFQHGNIYSNGCQKCQQFVMKGAVSDSSDTTCAAVLIIIASMVIHNNYFMSS